MQLGRKYVVISSNEPLMPLKYSRWPIMNDELTEIFGGKGFSFEKLDALIVDDLDTTAPQYCALQSKCLCSASYGNRYVLYYLYCNMCCW